jgi:hypothetical protein
MPFEMDRLDKSDDGLEDQVKSKPLVQCWAEAIHIVDRYRCLSQTTSRAGGSIHLHMGSFSLNITHVNAEHTKELTTGGGNTLAMHALPSVNERAALRQCTVTPRQLR